MRVRLFLDYSQTAGIGPDKPMIQPRRMALKFDTSTLVLEYKDAQSVATRCTLFIDPLIESKAHAAYFPLSFDVACSNLHVRASRFDHSDSTVLFDSSRFAGKAATPEHSHRHESIL